MHKKLNVCKTTSTTLTGFINCKRHEGLYILVLNLFLENRCYGE